MEKKKWIPIKMAAHPELAEKLKLVADSRGVSVSALLRMLVLKELSKVENQSRKAKNL